MRVRSVGAGAWLPVPVAGTVVIGVATLAVDDPVVDAAV